jgi:hypothetical protein
MMKIANRKFVTLAWVGAIGTGIASLVLFLGAPDGSDVRAQSLPPPKPFMVFDATMYTDKPDLSVYGIQPMTVTYTGEMGGQFGSAWWKQIERLPDKVHVQELARQASVKTKRIVLDIEHWPLAGDSLEVQKSLSKYMTVLQWVKEAAPGMAVGYYGAPPLADYWKSTKPPTSKEFRSYSLENDRLRPLAEAVDILLPSLYTFYTDRGGWVRYAYAQIAEARRYGNGKPVYVFLLPQYHDSNPTLKSAYLPPDFWRLQLQMAKQYADGIIIWGGWGGKAPMKWDNKAAWWSVTKEFMSKLPASKP